MEVLLQWISESKKDIKLEYCNSHYVVTYREISCKIIKPSKSSKFYMVSPNSDIDYEWYDILNRYCIEKFTTEKNLLARIIKFMENEKRVKNVVTKLDVDEKSIDDFDMAFYKMKSKLTKLVDTSICTVDTTDENVGIKCIYDKKGVANILINEFLDCWSWCKSQSNTKLDLLNDNIFSWTVTISPLTTINKEELHVEFELHFHNKFYPNCPPSIKIKSPILADSLMHRIPNSKMTQFAYWTPSRTTKYIINRIKQIIIKWGKEDKSSGTISETALVISKYLMKLSSVIDYVNDDCIDQDEDFKRFDMQLSNQTSVKKEHKKESSYWKKGTGYGHSGLSSWNPENYVKLQQEKNATISKVITKIVHELQKMNNLSSDWNQSCDIISKSLLIPYLISQFKNTTLLEMHHNEQLFKLYMSLIETLSTEKSIYLFDLKYNETNLYDVLKLFQSSLKDAMKLDDNNEFIKFMYNMLEILVFSIYDDNKKDAVDDKKILATDGRDKTIKQYYIDTLEPLKFDYADILNTNYHEIYKNLFKGSSGLIWNKCQKRLAIELPVFATAGSLPINYDASIFVRVDENSSMIIRALITGPPDTPYDSGCYIFDVYCHENYPTVTPQCWFVNHGGNRLNPNLYANGKVCLSLLGTWQSESKSECWNEKTSSLLQIFLSIQSQILIENPYFNEPGHESGIGHSLSEKRSKEYNNDIRLYVLKSTIRDLLKNPKLYPQFEDVIINHFKIKKEYIKSLCDKWTSEAPETGKHNINEFKKVCEEIVSYLDKF